MKLKICIFVSKVPLISKTKLSKCFKSTKHCIIDLYVITIAIIHCLCCTTHYLLFYLLRGFFVAKHYDKTYLIHSKRQEILPDFTKFIIYLDITEDLRLLSYCVLSLLVSFSFKRTM